MVHIQEYKKKETRRFATVTVHYSTPLGAYAPQKESVVHPVSVETDRHCLPRREAGATPLVGSTHVMSASALELAAYESDLFEVLGESSQLPVCSNNPYAVLQDVPEEGCTLQLRYGGRARTLVRWFSDLGYTKTSDPPSKIPCGGLRGAVRSCFTNVDPVGELSFKTVQKIEKSCCQFCLPRFEEKLSEWEDARSRPVDVDMAHLLRFKKSLAANVEKGWDNERRPFIPNGNATRAYRRRDGGNWNLEEFSSECRTELVFSSGKPRVVTLYSAHNTSVLAPLHYSMYGMLRRKGWLLVGAPTSKHVGKLAGADLLSFDYSSATDNIKTEYVRAAVEVLKEKADCLSDEEERALDVLANLNIGDGVAETGQPMGSVMSFPLLCVINKTVVDMALLGLLDRKEISYREWATHRLLVNGDDLLTREPRSDTKLREQVIIEGKGVGLVVNEEKTMVSRRLGEINSTLFADGHEVRKFNASAVWMDSGTEDVLGFAAQASYNGKTFRKLVSNNAHILAKQPDKQLDRLPGVLQGICRKDKRIRKALTSVPESSRTIERGVISMAERPEGYNLSRDEENEAMTNEIERVRERGVIWAMERSSRNKFRTRAIPNAKSYRSVLNHKREVGQELIPACYVRAYATKVKDALFCEEVAALQCELLPPGDGSVISRLSDNLRAFKLMRNAVRSPGTFDATADYVSLDC